MGSRFLDRQTNHTYAAKPTTYRGVTFRSRLEARWALVFDVVGLAWEYEPKCFRTEEGGYLPDFRCSWGGKRWWLEIKGPEPIARDYVRATAVQRQTGQKLRFFVGPVPGPGSHGILRTRILHGQRWRPADWATPWAPVLLDSALARANNYDFEAAA